MLIFSFILFPFLVRAETAFYGSNWTGSCITGYWISSQLFGAFFKNSNIYHARRWTTAIWLSSLFGHYCKYFISFAAFIFVYVFHFQFSFGVYLHTQAAARHQCTYLVNLHKKEFLEQHGDPNWLKGLDYIPAKLRAIYDINKILAHRP